MSSFSSAEATILQTLIEVQRQLGDLNQKITGLQDLETLPADIAELRETVYSITAQKDFYSTQEVADLMGVSLFTVQTRWCAEGRIDCEKDPATRRWRIPGEEYDRLRRGGQVHPR